MFKLVLDINYLVTNLSTCLARIGSPSDAPRYVNQHAFTVLSQTCPESRFKITTLGTNSRYQEPKSWRNRPHSRQRFRLGGANDQANIIGSIPLIGKSGDVLVQIFRLFNLPV